MDIHCSPHSNIENTSNAQWGLGSPYFSDMFTSAAWALKAVVYTFREYVWNKSTLCVPHALWSYINVFYCRLHYTNVYRFICFVIHTIFLNLVVNNILCYVNMSHTAYLFFSSYIFIIVQWTMHIFIYFVKCDITMTKDCCKSFNCSPNTNIEFS